MKLFSHSDSVLGCSAVAQSERRISEGEAGKHLESRRMQILDLVSAQTESLDLFFLASHMSASLKLKEPCLLLKKTVHVVRA